MKGVKADCTEARRWADCESKPPRSEEDTSCYRRVSSWGQSHPEAAAQTSGFAVPSYCDTSPRPDRN